MALNVADLVEHAADTVPDRIALVCGDRRVTYAELESRANKLAHHLAKNGVTQGSHVGLYARNSIELVEAMLAVYKLRAVAINVNYRYTKNELQYLFGEADLVALVHERRYSPLVAEVGAPGHTVVIDDESEEEFAGADYETALAGESGERDFAPRSGDDLYILFTGGTTGMPKGVMWRHEDVWRTLGGGIDFVTGERLTDEWQQAKAGKDYGLVRLCLPPLIHGAAQWAVLGALFSCSTVVLVPKFDPAEIWRVIGKEKVQVAVITGDAMGRPLIEEFQRGDYDGSSLYIINSSAALFSYAVKKMYHELLPHTTLLESIGSSETGSTGIGAVSKEMVKTDGTKVKLNDDTIVIDEDGNKLEPVPGVIGKLARGGHIPLGYYKDPEKTARMFVEVDGRRFTVPGDYARFEEDGDITLLGRGNTCVNTGGEKVFPEEVEAALKSHPDVYDALVIGVPDDRLGQRVGALVHPREGKTPTLSELDAHVRETLAGYKVPRSLWLVDEIGRTPTGKPDYQWARRHVEDHAHQPV
ncbi:acyl-CoA synthetase (AMP-forming)/AMP-acid ligase II [Lentzea atacamensis]|uniref:Acyl-CoA synthetase (AMP-forming)/AMP-acid ligase II n=1 Tax=Lentzea atacamensis TaxID=531938 RepID=A0ABX9EG66_9PSEU|nr:acyl-CoA synthetase [Lentzea atacamensis]RAS70176.1 acyl-CoA synthetase (AMP-forming)/AMP-acid ligase II [Lentzea atacamensis]